MGDRGYNIRGRVQGVGFRWWASREAERAGVVGWVRNMSDGSVEVMARGADEALERFERALRRGPPMSTVDHLQRVDCTLPGEVTEFSIER